MGCRLDRNELERIAALIRQRSGIALEEGKLQRACRKIEAVMRRHGMASFHPFYHALRFEGNEALMQELINAITINETYFWREHRQFEICCKKTLPHLDREKEAGEAIRILVAPCSSGEELYSIVMAILEEGTVIKKRNIEIVGIDIDSAMIAKAKRGCYTRRSVEKLPESFLRKYFRKKEGLYCLDEIIKNAATFLTGNIFDEALIKRLGKFDILFSRNMLIYFDDKEKEVCFDRFTDLLKEDGYLFLGHADAHRIDRKRFVPHEEGMQLFCKKGG